MARHAAVLAALMLLGTGRSACRASSSPTCGTFCFADTSGTLLLAPPDMSDPASMTTAVCKGGRKVAVELVGRQQATAADNGRQMAYNFGAQAGTVFRVRGAAVEADETCLLTSDSMIVGAVPESVGPVSDSLFCSVKSRGRLAAVRSRAVVRCWALSQVGKEHEVGLVEFARKGPDALASLVMIGPGGAVFEDFPTQAQRGTEDLWRVDDQGEMSPDGFEVLFALCSQKSYILGVSWGGTEGESLMLLVGQGGQRFTQCAGGYRYTAPL